MIRNEDAVERPFLKGLHIVLVEDHDDTRELYAMALRRKGAIVGEAANGRAALLLIDNNPPDLLLADIELPDMDGYTLLDAVRRLPAVRGGDTPAIALTGRTSASDRIEALNRGFQLHVPKPIDPDELTRLVGAVGASASGSRPKRQVG